VVGEDGQIERDGSSHGTPAVDPFLASLIVAVLVALSGLALELIGWMLRHRAARKRSRHVPT
jgi:hypothetical protein